MNQITEIAVYSSGSTRAMEPELVNAQAVTFSTQYPGGIYGSASFIVPRRVTVGWGVAPGNRVKFYSGQTCIWEGRITGWTYSLEPDAQSVSVNCTGYWGDLLMTRTWRKLWADTRLDNDVWVMPTTDGRGGDEDWYDIVRDDTQIEIAAKPGVAFANGDDCRITYTAPTGETIKRITYTLWFEEGGQNWECYIYNNTAAGIEAGTQYNTDQAANADDIALAVPAASVYLCLNSLAAQTAPATTGAANKVRAVWKDLTVYTETGSINLTEICKDVRAHVTELSAYEGEIDSNTYALVPFYCEAGETLADLLSKAAGYGDSTYDSWAVGILESDAGTDDKPVLFAEEQPALTDYDYIVRLDDRQLSQIAFTQDIGELKNWISFDYTGGDGRSIVVNPDDDANLKDAASIAAYGERHAHLSINSTNLTVCKAFARRYLEANSTLRWNAEGGIPVTGSIMAKSGEWVPVSQVRAGKRLRIANFLDDLSGTGLTFLITETQYEDESQTNTITVGTPTRFLVEFEAKINEGRKLN